jgi:hypothetical protein
MYHVTSSRNRESIRTHGLDWTRMGAAVGIAGSPGAEAAGCFVCRDDGEADYFVRMNNTGGPVDAWEIDGADGDDLVDAGSGYGYLPRVVPPEQLRLVRAGVDVGAAFSAPMGTGFSTDKLT